MYNTTGKNVQRLLNAAYLVVYLNSIKSVKSKNSTRPRKKNASKEQQKKSALVIGHESVHAIYLIASF